MTQIGGKMNNIIKKIIVGFCFAIILMLIKGDFLINAKAMTVSGNNVGSQTWSVNSSTNYWYVNKFIDNYWNNWGSGYIYFNIGISKRSTDSVAPLVSPKSIVLSTNNSSFACSIGSTSVNNSTYVNQNYSVVCPVNLTNTGLTLLTINLMPLNNTPIDTYEINFDGYMTFVNDSSDVNVNVDNSSSNSNRDQNFGNLITDNRNNTNSIIKNNDDNTNKIVGSVDKNTEENKKTNDILNNTDTTDAHNKGSNFFKNYNENSHGLSGIITAPLKFLQSLTGAKCTPLKFQLPFVHDEVQLQCMKSIYKTHFGVFYTLWQTITTGLIAYTVCLNFYKKIRDLQNPNNDKIEVLNL